MGSLKKNRKKRPGSGLQKHKRSIVAITAVIILLCGMVIVHGMALMANTPLAVMVLMSAWMPAPPLESLPAMVKAVFIQ